MQFPEDIIFDAELCDLQVNKLRKSKPLVTSECKFHIGHIYREIGYQLEQIGAKLSDDSDIEDLKQQLFLETGSITGTPSPINLLVHECIRHNCSFHFLRDVIDQYDSNGDVSGMKLLVALNRLRRGIWEYNLLERVELIEENYLKWSFRKCVFEMECINEVKKTLYNRSTMITKLLHKANHHKKLDPYASNSMLIFDMLHDEFLEQSANDLNVPFSFEMISSSTLLDCIKSLGIDIDSENKEYDIENSSKRVRIV